MLPPKGFTLLRNLTIAIVVALILPILLHIAAALAQTAAPAAAAPPSLTPSATALLSYTGLGQHAAGIASLIALMGFILAHAIAIMPAAWVPAAGATGFWPTIYTILNWIAGNYGKALNASAVKALLPFGLLVGIGLAGCAITPGNNSLATNLATIGNTATADLNTAIAVANSATPPDTAGAACAAAIEQVAADIQKTVAATPVGATVGAFTVAEIASLYQPGSPQTNAAIVTIETGCIGKLHEMNQANQSMIGLPAAIVAGLAITAAPAGL